MNTPLGSKKTSFDHRIESLRGLAALAVVVTHSSAVLQVDHSPAFWQLSLLKQSLSQQLLTLLVAFFSSGAAVILFFVLSGYVLTLSVCRQKSYESVRGLLSYAVRRLFRLIPPMWASIFLFWLVLEVVRTPENMSSFTLWFTSVFSVNLSAKDILENLFLIDFRANPVTWTMYTEVVGSAFIPASVALCTYWNRRISLWLLGGLALVTFFMYPRNPTGPLELPLLGALYLVCFQAGLVLALYREKNFLRARFCLLAFPVFMFERLLAPAPHLSILLLTAGAALLLYGVTRGTLEKFLSHSPLRLLGKISYSLYLFHCPVLYLVGIVAASLGLANLKGLSPALSIFMTAIPAAFLVAWGTYKSIEAPSIACGRKISEWLMCRKGEAA